MRNAILLALLLVSTATAGSERRIVTTSIEIDAPVEVVWDFFMDEEKWVDWNPLIPGIEGEFELDERIAETIQIGRLPMQLTFYSDIKKVVPYKEFTWFGYFLHEDFGAGYHQYLFEDLGDGRTLFIQIEEFSGKAVNSVTWPIMKRLVKIEFQKMDQALKEAVEASLK